LKFSLHRDELKRQFPELKVTKEYYEFNGTKKDNKRSNTQNNSLHLMFQQLSDECLDKGIEMRDIVRDELPIEVTPENIKWLWKKLQKALLKTDSTTQLTKGGQIELVYRNFNKILIERTEGEIEMPPWPCLKEMSKNIPKIDYPENNLGEITAF